MGKDCWIVQEKGMSLTCHNFKSEARKVQKPAIEATPEAAICKTTETRFQQPERMLPGHFPNFYTGSQDFGSRYAWIYS